MTQSSYYNATAYNSLSIAIKVPSATGGCVIPAVSILCYNPATGVTKTSGAVSVGVVLGAMVETDCASVSSGESAL